MAGQGTVTIKILGDAKNALAAFSEVGAKAESTGAKFKQFGQAAAAVSVVAAGGVAAVGVALFKIGESFDEAYDKIRVGTGAVGGDLDVLKDEFRRVVQDVPTDFGKASDAITVVQQKLGIAGDAAAGISEQFLELSRITKTDLATNLQAGTDALNNWGTITADQPRLLDEMFRATQLTGISFSDLSSQMTSTGTVLRDLGFNFEMATGLLATLKAGGIDVADIMPALSKSLATAAKHGKDASVAFADAFDAIAQAPDDIQAAKIAMETFGAKAGPKFASMIREGKISWNDMVTAISTGKDTIVGAGKDTQDFAEKWELFKNRVLVALEPLATKVFDGMGKAMDRLGPIVERISAAFSEHGLAGAFGVLREEFDKLDPKVKAAIIGFAALGAVLVAVFAPAYAITAGVIALGAGLVYAYTHCKTFHDAVDNLAQLISSVVTPIIAFMSEHSDQLKIILEGLAVVVGVALVASFVVIGTQIAVAGAAIAAVTVVATLLVQGMQALWDKAEGLRKFLVDKFVAGWSAVGGIISWVSDKVLGPLIDKIERVIELATTALDKLGAIASMAGLGSDTGVARDLLNSFNQQHPGGTIGGGGTIPMKGKFALGGIVPGAIGSPGWALVHGGETITPPGQSGGLHIHPGAFTFVQAPGENAADALPRELQALSFLMAG